jgi:hypothetical protein
LLRYGGHREHHSRFQLRLDLSVEVDKDFRSWRTSIYTDSFMAANNISSLQINTDKVNIRITKGDILLFRISTMSPFPFSMSPFPFAVVCDNSALGEATLTGAWDKIRIFRTLWRMWLQSQTPGCQSRTGSECLVYRFSG